MSTSSRPSSSSACGATYMPPPYAFEFATATDQPLTSWGSLRSDLQAPLPLPPVPRVFKGAHLDLPNISIYRAEEVSVDSDRPFDIYADGDAIGRTPATMRLLARCLRVIVPVAGAPEARS